MLPPPSTIATPMATEIATIAHTDDSSPELVPDRTVVAGPVRAESAISWTGRLVGRGEVLGEPAHHLGEHEPGDDRAEDLPALVVVVVADVEERTTASVPIHGEDAGGEEAAVDRRHRAACPGRSPGPRTRRRSRRARRWRGDQREDEAEGGVGADRVEGRDTEDDRGHQGHLVALEQVGGHPGAVADVVADVVGDRRRVAGVVLGDALLDLAHQVGADVGRLREDAAAHPHEQRQRAAEPEADEDRGGGVLEDHDDHGGAEQAQADREHPGDAAGAERDLERRAASRPWRPRRCGRCRARRGSSR